MSSAYFKVHTDNYNKREADSVSAFKIKKLVTMDNAFIMHRKPDEAIDDNILVSMMQNYGLDSNGIPKRLTKLPEGTKSMFELAEIKDDKLVIEGLTNEGFHNFRRQVREIGRRIKGQMSEEDKNLVGTTLMGQALMQFRNWIPGLATERFSSLTENDTLDEFDQGRFNIFFEEFMKRGFIPGLTEFSKLMADAVSMGLYKKKPNMKVAQRVYDKYKLENPNSKLTLEQYLELRKAKLRSMSLEIRIYLGFLSLLIFLNGGGDDDPEGKKRYQRSWAGRQAYNMLVRGEREIAFFFNPNTVMDLTRSVIPSMGLAKDIIKMVTNTATEGYEMVAGEDNTRDRTPMFFYTSKLLPAVNPAVDFGEIFEKQQTTLKW